MKNKTKATICANANFEPSQEYHDNHKGVQIILHFTWNEKEEYHSAKLQCSQQTNTYLYAYAHTGIVRINEILPIVYSSCPFFIHKTSIGTQWHCWGSWTCGDKTFFPSFMNLGAVEVIVIF